jgi:ferritin-like metal-binding protein YciE
MRTAQLPPRVGYNLSASSRSFCSSKQLTTLRRGHFQELHRHLHVVELILDDLHGRSTTIVLCKGVDESVALVAGMTSLFVGEEVVRAEPDESGKER